jgi:hypothetical protein
VSVFMSPRDNEDQFYPHAAFLFRACYDLQGYGAVTLIRLHTRTFGSQSAGFLFTLFRTSCKDSTFPELNL